MCYIVWAADYSSPPSSSSSEYSSDSESPWEDDSLLVMSPAPAQSKPLSAHLNPRADRTADPKLNNSLQVGGFGSERSAIRINNYKKLYYVITCPTLVFSHKN